ncbi:unnamed protein product [Heligmosomoides polygyrus]|uniref:Reverse transcriptase domain-containing protein n=1 Tax=Heligmosomoides polygyrus TaxID=6339 RepID=A0A183G784_HELPZ|nr:unnamed protein product [Heligmosomoides polygyrus]
MDAWITVMVQSVIASHKRHYHPCEVYIPHPLEKRQEIERQILQMLNDGIIGRRRDANSWRFTIDFRGLNAIAKPQQSILPNIRDITDLCASKCLYSFLDFQQGLHQFFLKKHTVRAFACFLDSFEYMRLPMGLKEAPATFKRIMDDLKIFIYIEDLIITSESPDVHVQDVDEVLGKIEQIGMKLKASKCEFATKKINFLYKDGIRRNQDKTKAINNYPACHHNRGKGIPRNVFIFRRWTDQCEQVMVQLKETLKTAPMLLAPRLGSPFVIETGSSAKGIAGVLKQDQDGQLKVMSHMQAEPLKA